MKRRDDFEDDGRTIADMSGVERPSLFGVRHTENQNTPVERFDNSSPKSEFPKEDRRAYILAAVLTALGVAAIFLTILGLAIWLMSALWL